jgi:hypothetical protein
LRREPAQEPVGGIDQHARARLGLCIRAEDFDNALQ